MNSVTNTGWGTIDASLEDCLAEVVGMLANVDTAMSGEASRDAGLARLAHAIAELEGLVDQVDPDNPLCADVVAVSGVVRRLCHERAHEDRRASPSSQLAA